MKINVKDMEKLTEAISNTERNCSARLLKPERIRTAILKAEKKLSEIGIPKKSWKWCLISLKPEAVPNNYHGTPYGTHATIGRFPSGWFLINVSRTWCDKQSYGRDERDALILSQEAKEAIPSQHRI